MKTTMAKNAQQIEWMMKKMTEAMVKVMQNLLFFMVVTVGSLMSVTCVQAAETAYFSALPDIPVMPGLTEIPDRTVVFDKAEGRVVETLAQAPHTGWNQVVAFYDQSLKQLGWTVVKPGLYARENEQLLVKLEQDAEGGQGKAVVRFFLAPDAREKF